jgi:septal ring factor EnvC (AmiA/AmiB activator)
MGDEPIERLVRSLKDDLDAVEAERDWLQAELHRERETKRIIDQALLEAVAERDRLRTVVWDQTKLRASLAGARCARDEAREERDRLRAVVDGLRGYLSLQDVGEEPSEVTGVFADLRAILAESAEATDG